MPYLESRQRLYDFLTQNKVNLGKFDDFNSAMDVPERRAKFYNFMADNNINLGPFDVFEGKIKQGLSMEIDEGEDIQLTPRNEIEARKREARAELEAMGQGGGLLGTPGEIAQAAKNIFLGPPITPLGIGAAGSAEQAAAEEIPLIPFTKLFPERDLPEMLDIPYKFGKGVARLAQDLTVRRNVGLILGTAGLSATAHATLGLLFAEEMTEGTIEQGIKTIEAAMDPSKTKADVAEELGMALASAWLTKKITEGVTGKQQLKAVKEDLRPKIPKETIEAIAKELKVTDNVKLMPIQEFINEKLRVEKQSFEGKPLALEELPGRFRFREEILKEEGTQFKVPTEISKLALEARGEALRRAQERAAREIIQIKAAPVLEARMRAQRKVAELKKDLNKGLGARYERLSKKGKIEFEKKKAAEQAVESIKVRLDEIEKQRVSHRMRVEREIERQRNVELGERFGELEMGLKARREGIKKIKDPEKIPFRAEPELLEPGKLMAEKEFRVTPTEKAKLDAELADILTRLEGVEKKSYSESPSAIEATTKAFQAIKESIRGLDEILGKPAEGRQLGTGFSPFGEGAFSRRAWENAKPHLENAWKLYKEAGKGFTEFAKDMENQLGHRVSPYLAHMAKNESTAPTVAGFTQDVIDAGKARDVTKRNIGQIMLDIFDVEAPWKRAGTPETGFALKNAFSTIDRWERHSLKIGEETSRSTAYNGNILAKSVLKAEDPTLSFGRQDKLVSKPAKIIEEYHKNMQKEYAKRGVKLDFKERILSELTDLIDKTTEPGLKDTYRQLRTEAQKMNFVHIPSALWFDAAKINNPKGALKVMAAQKRKTFRIRDLVEEGKVPLEELHPVDIIANYGRRAGKDFALLDILNAAKKEGLATMKPVAGYTKIPGYISPAFAKLNVHPTLARTIYEMQKGYEFQNPLLRGWSRVASTVKGLQFYNPIVLPMNDVVQGYMLGVLRTTKGPKYVARGMWKAFKGHKDFYEALDHGLASKPYQNPWRNWKDMVESVKKSPNQRVKATAMDLLSARALKTVYNLSQNLAWKLDEGMRMAGYEYARNTLKLAPREAAQLAAKFHGDYASVPIKTRRAMNLIFFTPTYKVAMSKLFIDMFKGLVSKGKHPKAFRNGLVAALALQVGFDVFMDSQGFQREQFGRTYTRTVETDEGPKEAVVTWTRPDNLINKFAGNAIRAARSNDVTPAAMQFLRTLKWELTPIIPIAQEAVSGIGPGGERIFEPFDSPGAKLVKGLRHAATRGVALIGAMEEGRSERLASDALAKDLSTATNAIIRTFMFTRARDVKAVRMKRQIDRINREFNAMARRIGTDPDPAKRRLTEEQIDEYRRKLQGTIEEFGFAPKEED